MCNALAIQVLLCIPILYRQVGRALVIRMHRRVLLKIFSGDYITNV